MLLLVSDVSLNFVKHLKINLILEHTVIDSLLYMAAHLARQLTAGFCLVPVVYEIANDSTLDFLVQIAKISFTLTGWLIVFHLYNTDFFVCILFVSKIAFIPFYRILCNYVFFLKWHFL